MWPISLHRALRNRRQYNGKRVNQQKRLAKDRQRDPSLPKPLPQSYAEGASVLREITDRRPLNHASSPYPERFYDALNVVDGFLATANLEQDSHANLQLRLREEVARKSTSRRSISKGGRVKIKGG